MVGLFVLFFMSVRYTAAAYGSKYWCFLEKERFFLNDRFVTGIIAGSLAYLPTWIYNHFAHNYHFAKIRFVDFSAIMILGAPAKTNWEIWFTRFGTMFFLSLCGALFVFLIPQISSRYFMIKGWFFAVSLWFLIFSVTKLFKVEGLSKPTDRWVCCFSILK